MTGNLLEIRDLHKRYGSLEVLSGVDCTMRQGRCHQHHRLERLG
jgi:polar amino acid transport system ATP-binding protein